MDSSASASKIRWSYFRKIRWNYFRMIWTSAYHNIMTLVLTRQQKQTGQYSSDGTRVSTNGVLHHRHHPSTSATAGEGGRWRARDESRRNNDGRRGDADGQGMRAGVATNKASLPKKARFYYLSGEDNVLFSMSGGISLQKNKKNQSMKNKPPYIFHVKNESIFCDLFLRQKWNILYRLLYPKDRRPVQNLHTSNLCEKNTDGRL
jgi:hypothetical protein